MEGQGDNSATKVPLEPNTDTMNERGDAPSHGAGEEDKIQEDTVTSSNMETQVSEQSVDPDSVKEGDMKEETKEEDAYVDKSNEAETVAESIAKESSEKDSTASDENIDSTQDDKEGSTDSQSEPFEMVKIPESGNSSDNGQGEATPQGSTSNLSVDPDSVKESDVKEEKKEEDAYVDILGNGLLKKKVLKKGGGRETRPNHGDMVTLNVEGRLDDDTVVDKQESFTFALGDGDVIQAWDLAVSLMEMGEQCELVTAAKYAYGEMGREEEIPPNARITYTIELVSKEESPDLSKMTVQERLEKGETKRERGNFLFVRKDFTGAINSYSKGLTVLQYPGSNTGADQGTLQELIDSTLKCSNNLAACQLKIEAYDAAIRSCESVLKCQPENVKALYRIGKAYGAKGDSEQALTYLRKALKIDPSSKILHAEMSKLTKKVKKDTDSEREMYRRMMGTDGNPSKKPGGTSWWKLPLMFGGVLAGIVSIGLAVAYRYGQH